MRRLLNIALILVISSLSVKSVYGHFDNKINKGHTDTTQYTNNIYTFKTSKQCEIESQPASRTVKDYTAEEMRAKTIKDKTITIKGKKEERFTLYELPERKNPNFYLSSEEDVAVIRKGFDEYKPNYIGIYSDDELNDVDTIEIEGEDGKVVYRAFTRELFKCNSLNTPIFENERSVIDILNSDEEVLLLQYGNYIFKSYKVNVNKA